MRTLPIGRETQSPGTSGVAFAIPQGDADPFFPATQVTIYVSGQAFIGFGPDNTPPAASTSNSTYQEATTVAAYDINFPNTANVTHIYVYAASGTIDARVSWFG